jgi:hypothetical protein
LVEPPLTLDYEDPMDLGDLVPSDAKADLSAPLTAADELFWASELRKLEQAQETVSTSGTSMGL